MLPVIITGLLALVLGIMFAGAAGLSDCNMPEDVNFRGVELLRTPSPAAWSKSQTPGTGASCPASASAKAPGCDSQVGPGTPETLVRKLSSSPFPTKRRGITPLSAEAGRQPGAAPPAVLTPLGQAGDFSTPGTAGAAEAPALGQGRGRGRSHSQDLADETPAAEAVEAQPKKRARRSGQQSTSQPAATEEPEAEPAAEEAEAAEAEVQPKTRAGAKGRPSTSSPAVTEQADAEGAVALPKKRARRSGPSTSRPAAEEAVEGATVTPEADAAKVDDGVALGSIAAPDAEAAAVDGRVALGAMADMGQHVDWDAVRKFKTFAGRYMPSTPSGCQTWMTRRNLFFSLAPHGYQKTRLQLVFWKFLSEKMQAGMSEGDAARMFLQEGPVGAAEDAD